MNRKTGWLGILLFLAVASCGGDGPGLADLRNGPLTETPEGEQTVAPDTVQLFADTSQLQSDGTTTVTLSAIAKNANNQTLVGVPVEFIASSGTLSVTQGETNEQGIAIAEFTIGGDPTNRTVVITATAGGVEDVVELSVIGSSISIQGPTSLVNSSQGEYAITLSDAAGNGIPSETVEVVSENGNTLSASTVTTDSNGKVTVFLTGDTPGKDTLRASALPDGNGDPTVSVTANINVSPDNFEFLEPASDAEVNLGDIETVSVHWEKSGDPQINAEIRFATTRGNLVNPITAESGSAVTALTDGNGDATVEISSTDAGFSTITATAVSSSTTIQRSIEFIATNPTKVELQVSPATIPINETSTITAIVRDPANNLVKGARIEFSLNDNTNGSLSTPVAITDSQGRAQTVYTASSTPSADNGVVITGNVVGGSNPSASTNLTVSGRALFINFGTGNSIIENDSDTHYIKDYVVFVTDSSGAGVPNQTVNISVLSDTYLKGYMVGVPPVRIVEGICQNEDLAPFNGILDLNEDQNFSEYPEDLDSDGVMDAGEDANNNGFLDQDPGWNRIEPGNRALVSPGTVTTDEAGLAEFQLIYPQDHALWLNVTVTAKAMVAGTESVRSQRVLLPMSAQDEANPPNSFSPFGTDFYGQLNCSNMNTSTNFYDPDTIP